MNCAKNGRKFNSTVTGEVDSREKISITGTALPGEMVRFIAMYMDVSPRQPSGQKSAYANEKGDFSIEYEAPKFVRGIGGITLAPSTVYCTVSRLEANVFLEVEYPYPTQG